MRISTCQVYDRSASIYHQRLGSYGPYKQMVREFLAGVPAGGRVLDLGSGSGVHARMMVEAGLQVLGVDFSPAMLDIARRECPGADFMQADLRDLPAVGAFDALLASFCIVHFEDGEARTFLQGLPRFMKPQALLCLSFMEGRKPGWQIPSFADRPLFYNYFERAWIVELLSAVGLELIGASDSDYPEEDGSTTTDVCLRFKRVGSGC